ncbi:hypothetical protein HPP92_000102 [Vanilla planifolia]|uniref:Dirigent protein n=1 Tax=Vanilla planifolia TaxID=51239 RepID=A0A835RWV3_VANPL|nr:hypothetical protein HPP92_000090 [Vanilla planifolia]KAG0500030.1 hypothetical protein HPP92_000102 [Vanilla planifolia]
MAKLFYLLSIITIIIVLATTSTMGWPTNHVVESVQTTHSRFPIDDGGQKQTHLRFFWHNFAGEQQPTAITIAQGPTTNSSKTKFGLLNAFDDPITVGPNLSSQLLGQSQGIYASTDQKTAGLLMVMNFFFSYGNYKGSTLTILGRNQVFNEVREMPILGGTGLFRFARGFVEARTHSVDSKSSYTIVQYDCYIFYY